jgi:hypothetical protein
VQSGEARLATSNGGREVSVFLKLLSTESATTARAPELGCRDSVMSTCILRDATQYICL